MFNPVADNNELIDTKLKNTEIEASFDLWQRRILWQCKRGNLETELLLYPYIEQLSASTSPQQRQLIETFLTESEQNLFHWLIGQSGENLTNHPIKTPIKPQYSALIADIKHSYLAKPQ